MATDSYGLFSVRDFGARGDGLSLETITIQAAIEANRKGMLAAIAWVEARFGTHYPLVVGGREVRTDKEIASLNPSNPSEIVGFVAGFGSTFAAVPDLIAMLERRPSKGLNPRMAAIVCVFQVAWLD